MLMNFAFLKFALFTCNYINNDILILLDDISILLDDISILLDTLTKSIEYDTIYMCALFILLEENL